MLICSSQKIIESKKQNDNNLKWLILKFKFMKVPSIHCFEKIYQVSSISSHLSAGSWSLQLPYAAPRGPGKALASPQVCISAAFFPHKKWWQNRVRMGLISVATSTWPNFSSETRRWGFTTGNAEPKSNALRASSSSLLGIFCYQDVLRVIYLGEASLHDHGDLKK